MKFDKMDAIALWYGLFFMFYLLGFNGSSETVEMFLIYKSKYRPFPHYSNLGNWKLPFQNSQISIHKFEIYNKIHMEFIMKIVINFHF